LLNPNDLEIMMNTIKKDSKILQIGIEPAFLEPSIRLPKMSDSNNFDSVGGVTIWRSKLYFKFIEEAIKICLKNHAGLTEISSYIGFLGNQKGFKSVQATKSRMVYYD